MRLRHKITLVILSIISLSFYGKSQTWNSFPDILAPNLGVYDFISYQDTLVIAGNFAPLPPFESYSVVGWDSVSWISYPGISKTTAYSLSVYQGNVIVGGGFDNITDPDDIEKLAVWNGTSWEQLGGMNWSNQTNFWHLCVYHDTLFAAGQGVSSSQQSGLTFMVRWDGDNFQSASPYASTCFGLYVFEDKLYSGLFSTFNLDNGELVHGITVYDGERWDHVYDHEGNLFTPTVTNMLVDTINHDFYIAGVEVYRWDGEKYHHLAYLGGEVYKHAMCFYRGDLYIGGNFVHVNWNDVDYMARWDGADWSADNIGVNQPIEAMYEYKDELYVGGYFDTVAGNIGYV